MQDEFSTIEQDTDATAYTAEDLTEELLVEEVSIDGMCGVY
ncbi:mycofactocin precursor MftA [Streptomyces sp. NPDC053542]